MLHKKWVIRQADKEAASAISEQFNIDPFLAFLLVSRGLTDDLAVQEFLTPVRRYALRRALRIWRWLLPDRNRRWTAAKEYACTEIMTVTV